MGCIFTDHTLINFTYKNQPLAGFGFLELILKVTIFCLAEQKKKLCNLIAGNFIRFIGSKGQPGEYQGIGNLFFDREDNLYLYDLSTRCVSIFTYPDYHFFKTDTSKIRGK